MANGQLINAGIILLTVIGIAYGGAFLLRVVGGKAPVNDLQRTYFRAGHAHAGVLVTLGLVITLLLSTAGITGPLAALSSGVLWAAILMPAGFFLSVIGHNPAAPNKLRYLIGAGGISLTVGLAAAGIALITAGIDNA